jgi:hypothetical protein
MVEGMTASRIALGLTVAAFGVMAITARKIEPVQISVSPAICFAPCPVKLRVRVEPDPQNRALAVTAWCDGDAVRSSAYQVDGTSPITHWIEWRGLPACAYMIGARVTRERGSVEAHTPLLVRCGATCG